MIEKEIRVLEINKNKFVRQIMSMGAVPVDEDLLQRRYVYDIDPRDKTKWMRLRTNGKKTTLTVKQILDRHSIAGTEEHEIEIENFEVANTMLNKLGFKPRNYQENIRSIYKLGGVEISIDTWPLIPTYAELEGESEAEIVALVQALGIKSSQLTTLDVTSIYKDIYGIDMLKIKNLKLGEKHEGMLEHNK